jgi:hypothetical protein
LPPFVAHDVLLIGQRRLVERVEQVAHAIGVGPERQLELVGRDCVEVIGAVERGGRVGVRAADAFEQLFGHPARDVLAAGKHHVLEQVREPGPALLFVCRPDVVPDIDRDQRQRAVLRQDDFEAVGQVIFFVGNDRRHFGRRRGKRAAISPAHR